ncbi:MAG: hypothetical protein KatS3mg031_1242 [Chitinophagales bacterium]|nr:MAG: hypothetical protein KatS3mg031_1242 [Chitinophagales bacterium]
MPTKELYYIPLYLAVIYLIALVVRNKFYPEGPLRKYFIPALTVKLIGAIGAGVIYFYYYQDGDTVYYYYRITYFNWLFSVNSSAAWKALFADTTRYHPQIQSFLDAMRAWDTSQFLVVRFGAVLSLIVGKNYWGIALAFAVLSFTGVWALFRTFRDINPHLTREFAISCLFIPSVFFWGSGVFKDTIAIGFIGWLTHAVYMIFIKRKNLLVNIPVFLFSFYILMIIKAYIVMAFIPSLLFWIFFKYRSRIQNKFLRLSITPLIILFSVSGAYIALTNMSAGGGYWSLDEISDRAKDMQWWHTKVVELYGEGGGGSYYSIGSGDFSLGNIIQSFPLAVNVTLFRPYLWEVHNPVMFLSALESLALFIFTLRIIFSVGFGAIFRISIANPEVFFALLFSIIFAFAVGFTSFNFGALVRYKIPCIPFYVMALFIIRYHANMAKNAGALAVTEK